MCGIIGYIGKENSLERLVDGLRALEYRGYDSAGIAYFDGTGHLQCQKSAGRLFNLERLISGAPSSYAGIGHTRWATHGAPSDANSHPHGTEQVKLVHNGIIENYAELKSELEELGYTFESDTDTEAAAKLLDHYYKTGQHSPRAAIEKTVARLRGSWAFGIMFADRPEELWAAAYSSPLIVGIGEDGNFIASDIPAILRHTRKYYRLSDGEIAVVTSCGTKTYSQGAPTDKKILTAHWDIGAAERGGFDHFMLKEINEEPNAIRATLHSRIRNGLPSFLSDSFDSNIFSKVSRLHIVACGTAMHAGLIAKGAFARLAGLPCDVEIASEFRYNTPLIGTNDQVIVISQSGETADSLAALRLAKAQGAHTLAIVNVVGSSIAREADSVLYTMAGPEIAVASTKAYSVQTALLYLLAIEAGTVRGKLTAKEATSATDALYNAVPEAISRVITDKEQIKNAAYELANASDLFFIGRNTDYYLACEASLKLKEISYIHSEAYAAGELKHGTISLIDYGVPVIALCTVPSLYEKTASNIRETKARGAKTLLICLESQNVSNDVADRVIYIPEIEPALAFLPAATAVQLLAYYTALIKGCDIDKPRNLAKSVTVE